ncbi:uncharacterized protein LOC129288328 [Prosopis cineraria]|uniref:uncharacterized protein LOC129288328 n=1 Tax=Prosopis cineraria TaxID=364024 RepID=UPI00240F5F4B|nr:uncharacterized protein LOC129288328 [Prosopis cineraria]
MIKWLQMLAVKLFKTALLVYNPSVKPTLEVHLIWICIACKILDSSYGSFEQGKAGFSSGLNSALAMKGVIVMGKALPNLNPSELKQHGAVVAEPLSGFPLHVRGSVIGEASKISKAQFGKLLKLVTNHLSSVPNIFVHDGAIGSLPNCDAKVRVISDSPSATLSLSNLLCKTNARSISHDTCPLTVYVATSISSSLMKAISVEYQSNNGFVAADIERSSLVLCHKAFSDASTIKKALSALSEPVISARGGIPLRGRILVSGDSVFVLFAAEDTIQSCANFLVSTDAGIILSPQSVAPLFQTGNTGGSNIFKLPAAIVLVSSDSSECIPSISKLSPGQAASHFLAGYQNGNFVPSFNHAPSCIDPLELAKALLAKLKDNQISAYLININKGGKTLSVKDFVKLVESTLSKDVPPFYAKGGDLKRKYKAFLSEKYPRLPEEFSF